VVSGNATISGNTLTAKGPGAIVVRATQLGNDTIGSASADITVTPGKASQTISLSNLADVPVTSGTINLTATASSGLPVTLTVSGPARLSGNVLTLNGVTGTVTVRATQSGNDTYNPASEVVRTFNIRAIGQQVYLGTMGADTFAVIISQDGKTGLFITRIAATGEAIVAKFTIGADGSFRTVGTSSTPSESVIVSPVSSPSVAALTAPRTISGTVVNGVVSGTIAELGTSFTANAAPATGPTASLAGVYTASVPGAATGETYIVVGPNSQAYAVSITPTGVTSGTGTVTADGSINVTTATGSIVGNIDTNTGGITGTVKTGANTAAFVGLSEATEHTDRIINISSRLRVVAGDASRSVIAGFVVSGTESKQVLVRAIGPGLTGFGVTDALANPKLQLYRGSTLVAENDDWSNNAQVSTTGDNVGAFKLGASSRDSALVANLEPGAYTAVVTGVNGNGVALIEVYDAASNAPISAQQLVNISTRGYVDTGEGNLIAGFVVTGNAPKRVLIRGIGPGLSQFNVPGVVADPMLKIYAQGSSTVIAQNNDWGTAQPINAAQVVASAADITAASTAAGAFPLPAGSKDAAILVTLMPGQYSAVVSGVNNTTGAGLVEVYEVSN
jgi:hypothetical protein